MLFLRRSHCLLGTDAERGVTALRSPGLRVYLAWMTGRQRFDTGVLGMTPAAAAIEEVAISIQLGGELTLRVGGREIPVRDGSVAAVRMRSWDERWEGSFRVLVVEWSGPTAAALPDLDHGPLGGPDRAAVTAFAERLERGELRGEGAAQAVRDLLGRLQAAGIATPNRTDGELCAGMPPGAQGLADALGRSMSQLHAGPQIEDLAQELGTSGRQVRRRLRALGEWLPPYASPEGWRRQLRLIRATLAASFLTRRDASLEQVARSLGYGSSRALLLALAQERLPAPRVLRAV